MAVSDSLRPTGGRQVFSLLSPKLDPNRGVSRRAEVGRTAKGSTGWSGMAGRSTAAAGIGLPDRSSRQSRLTKGRLLRGRATWDWSPTTRIVISFGVMYCLAMRSTSALVTASIRAGYVAKSSSGRSEMAWTATSPAAPIEVSKVAVVVMDDLFLDPDDLLFSDGTGPAMSVSSWISSASASAVASVRTGPPSSNGPGPLRGWKVELTP